MTSGLLLLAASTDANNDVSMGSTTDGSTQTTTVPKMIDLAQCGTEIVDTFKVQSEVARTIAERAHESGKEYRTRKQCRQTSLLCALDALNQ